MSELEEFRESAHRAIAEMNERIDKQKVESEARHLAEQAARGVERVRTVLKTSKFAIAMIVASAAAVASVWDLARLTGELGADYRWGIAAGGAIDLGWIYLLLEIYSHRDDPAKALKPYRKTGGLLALSAVLNAISGVLSGSQAGVGMIVLGGVSVLMPLLLKAVITPLVLGGSLASELLTTRQGRSRVGKAAEDRHGRALATFDAAYRLSSERDEHAAQIELERQRARFEAERESIALELQRTREDLARTTFETMRGTSPTALSGQADSVPGQADSRLVPTRTSEADDADSISVPVDVSSAQTVIPINRDGHSADKNGRKSVIDVVRTVYTDDADTQEIQRVVVDAVPDARPDTVARAVRRVRAERHERTGTDYGQYL